MPRQFKENLPLCQGEHCKSNFSGKTLAVKVCYQCDCESTNTTTLPVRLCLECDQTIHAGKYKNHERSFVKRNDSVNKMSSSKIAESDSGAEDDHEPVVPAFPEKMKSKSVATRRKFMKLPADNSKKKPRRHNTDDPGRDFIRLKVYVGDSGDFTLEMIPALKGKNLKESLDPILEKHNITFDSHSVFLDSSNTPLPLAFETFPLSGSILHVRDNSRVNVDKRVRDLSKNFESKPEQPVSRTPSFGKKAAKEEKEGIAGKPEEEKEAQDENTKKGKRNTPSPMEVEDRIPSILIANGSLRDTTKAKPASLLGIFAANPAVLMAKSRDISTVRTLPEILQYFTVHGLESEANSPGSDEQEFYLEESWTKVVEGSEELGKNERDQQEAIWELLATEVAYINKLQVIKKIFILCLRNLQNEGYLRELDFRSLFSNIDSIYAVNVGFWLRTLKSVVNMARHTKKLLDPFYMADGFSSFDSLFEPYIQYCMEDAGCLKFLKQKLAEDEQFRLYVEWCESRPECKRLKLNDLLVKPMQRVTKYPLLLKAILKKTVDDDKRDELIAMIETVEKFVGKVNVSMKIRHEKEKLSRTSVKIEYFWSIEPVTDEVEKCLMDNYCEFDLICRPMPGVNAEQHRCLLYEGALRLTEKQGRMDVYAFLFTDMLLLTKAKKTDKFKVVKVPMRIDKIRVHDLKDPGNFLVVYLNEYRTVVQAYVFQASQNVKEKWVKMINKAKNLYRAVLENDGTKCLTADDADDYSPATTPCGSPTLRRKRDGTDSPDAGIPRFPPSPRLHRHLSGSDGNLSLLGHNESTLVRRASCNERKTKPKRESPQRKTRTDSKIARSTSDPHNKPLHLEPGALTRSSSAPKSPRPIPEKDLLLLTESSVDPDSPRSTTSPSEVDLTVDVNEIQMSLSPDGDIPGDARKEQLSKESSEKLKALLAQKLSDAKKDDVRHRAGHPERRKPTRSSSLERSRRSSQHKVESPTSPMGEPAGRKLSSHGNRQLPDPSQISARGSARTLPPGGGAEERTSGKISDLVTSGAGLQSLQDLSDSLEMVRSQAPRIKEPLMTGLPISRTNSGDSEQQRKRSGHLPRRSPHLYRKAAKADNAVRSSLDEQLLASMHSPPTPRRAKSEADTPVEALRSSSKPSEQQRPRTASCNSENSDSSSLQSEESSGRHPERRSRKSDEHSKHVSRHSKARASRPSKEADTKTEEETLLRMSKTRGTAAATETQSRSPPPEDARDSNPNVSAHARTSAVADSDIKQNTSPSNIRDVEMAGKSEESAKARDKPRRQMKKYRGRDAAKAGTTTDAKKEALENGSVGTGAKPTIMLESTEYV